MADVGYSTTLNHLCWICLVSRHIEQSTTFAVNHFELKLGHNHVDGKQVSLPLLYIEGGCREWFSQHTVSHLLSICHRVMVSIKVLYWSPHGTSLHNLTSCTSYWKALDLWVPNRANDYQKKPTVSPVYIPSESATLLRNFNFNIQYVYCIHIWGSISRVYRKVNPGTLHPLYLLVFFLPGRP
jgi:hypothetical protein